MKMSWCLVDEVTVDLTGVTPLSIGDGSRNHLWPLVAKSSELIFKFRSGLVSSAHTIVSFHKGFLCLSVQKAAKQDPIIRSAI